MDRIWIYAVDFDGTLYIGDNWPYVEGDNWNWPLISAIEYLQKIRPNDQWVLWTCRDGWDLKLALKGIRSLPIRFDAINDNAPEAIRRYGCNPRKVIADYYIDDKSCSPESFVELRNVNRLSQQNKYNVNV